MTQHHPTVMALVNRIMKHHRAHRLATQHMTNGQQAYSGVLNKIVQTCSLEGTHHQRNVRSRKATRLRAARYRPFSAPKQANNVLQTCSPILFLPLDRNLKQPGLGNWSCLLVLVCWQELCVSKAGMLRNLITNLVCTMNS